MTQEVNHLLQHFLLNKNVNVILFFVCSGFSTEVVFYTMGTLPALPLAPRLVRAGVSWVTLEWGRPEGSPSEEQLKYTLEIQEDNTVSTTHVCSTPIL